MLVIPVSSSISKGFRRSPTSREVEGVPVFTIGLGMTLSSVFDVAVASK